jgi:hypothetical protein
MARCPLHEDRTPSLSLLLLPGGDAIWLHCFSCCGANDRERKKQILARAGLTMGDLYAPKSGHKPQPLRMERLVACYPYTDEEGRILYEKLRYEPKTFRLRRPDGRGGHVWGLDGVTRRVPFNLPLMLARPSDPVYLCEGEKDALAAESLGLVGACTVEGAGSGWHSDCYPPHFAGRDVAVVPHEDEGGLRHATLLVGALLLGGAASVRVVRLPVLQDHGDLADWLEAGGTRAALECLAASARRWS